LNVIWKSHSSSAVKVHNGKTHFIKVFLPRSNTVAILDHSIPHTNYFTLNRLNTIFGQNFINGYLIIYIDGKVVFNGTVDDNPNSILFEILASYLGQHEIKVEYTKEDKTQTYTKNVTI